MSALHRLARRAGTAGLALLLAFAAADAAAQRAFTQRFSTNANGDMLMTGNANMTCPIGAANCAAARAGGNFADNDFTMEDIDVDSDPTTFNSSSATLNLPAGSTVLWAGLYWGANTAAVARNQVLFQRPFGFGYQVVTASQVDTTGGTQYGAFADVTSIVQAGGAGTYTTANIQRTLGVNQWAGWSLVVAYRNNGETLKNITIFDGFQLDPVTTTVSGFLTPLSGPITTRLGFVGYDGDRDSTSAGESFTINGVPIVDGQNPSLNFYNSTISNLGSPNTARNPAYDNTLGFDIDRVNAPAGAVTNGATSATIELGAATEQIWIQVVAFSTDIYVPVITPNVVKTATDLNGGGLNRGDTIRYAISLSNSGQDTGTNVVLTDPIPANTTYVPGSLVITSGANAGAKSDTPANDQAEFATGPNRVIFRLGTGADGTNGGSLAFGQSTSVQFDVTVDAATPPGYQITNTASISYSGQTLGSTFGTSSAATNSPVTGPPSISKTFTPNTIPNAGTSVLEIVVSNPAANPANLTGVTFSDTYPAGLVNTLAPSPAITCTAGSTPGTVTAAAGGNSVALSPGATIPPGGSCSITVNVTSTTDGVYNNTTGAVQATNGGTGGTASATLGVGRPRITKGIAPAAILSGGTATVTLTLMNPTAGAITGVAFSDTLTNMTVAGAPAATNGCGGTFTATGGASSVNLSGGTIGGGATCTITFPVTSTTTGVHPNTTTGVTSTETGAAGNPSNTVTLTVVGAPVASKSFSAASTNPNVPVQLTITVSNPNTTTTLTGVDFTDTYPDPAGATVQMTNENPPSRTLNCTAGSTATATGGVAAGTTVGMTGGSLLPMGSCTITVNVESTSIVAPVQTYNNTTGPIASANGGTGAAANASLVVGTLAAPVITKSFAPASIAAGGTSVMTITINNAAGAAAVTGIDFTDTYPAGLVNAATPAAGETCPAGTVSATAGGNSLTFTGGTVNAGTSCTVTVTVTSPAGGSRFNNTGPVSTANAGTAAAGTATLNVLTPPIISKAFNPTAVATNGDSLLTFSITNPNNVALTGVGFTDVFPVGTSARNAGITNTCGGTFQDSGGGGIGNGDPGVRLNNDGTIAANTTCTLTVTVRGNASGTYTNTSGAVTATGPVALTGNTATANFAVGQLNLAKSFASPIAPGATSLLTFTISNSTGANRTGVAFTDTYPAGLVNATPLTVGGSCTGITTTAVAGGNTFNLTSAGVVTAGCTVTVLVTTATPGTYLNQTSGLTHSTDATPGSPSNVATLIVRTQPVITKGFTPAAIVPNASSTLTFTIANANGDAMTGVGFTDTFPAGMVVHGTPAPSNTCGGTFERSLGGAIAGGDVGVRLVGGTIPANTTCTITVNVTSAASGSYNNSTGTVSTTNAGTGAAANAALVVMTPPTVAKSFAPASIGLNEISTLTVTLTNPNGAIAITGAAFTDTYPAGMVNSATPNGSSSCGGTVTATAAAGSMSLSGGTIPAGGSCTVTVQVTATTTGAKLNTTSVVTTTNAGTSAAGGSATLTVLSPITVAKAFGSSPVGLGQPSVMTVTLTNPNATAVTGAAFSDVYPANLVNTATANGATTCVGSPVVTAANNGTSLAITGATVPANGSCTVTVNVTSTTAGSYLNSTGTVTTANAGSAAAATGTLTVIANTLTKAFAPAAIVVGGTSTLVFTLTNGAGNPAQAGINFTDTLPAGLVVAAIPNLQSNCPVGAAQVNNPAFLAAVAGSNTITVTGAAMNAALASCTIRVDVTTAASPTTTACPVAANTNNAASVTATQNTVNGVTPQCLAVSPAVPALDKAFGGALTVGGSQVLTFTVSQPAGNPTQAFSFTDTLPAGLVVGAGAVGGTCTGGTVTATAGTNTITVTNRQVVNPATSCTITVPVTTAPSATVGTCPVANNTNGNGNIGATTNVTAAVTNSAAGGGTSATGACVTVNAATPSVDKAFGGALTVGGSQVLTFTVSQPAGNPTQTFSFTDTLPAGLVVGAGATGGTCTGGTVTATAGTNTITVANRQVVNPATSCTITIPVTTAASPTVGTCPVANNTNGNGNIGATTNVTAAVANSAAGGGTSATGACVTVNAATPSVDKAFGGALTVGGSQTLTFTVSQPTGNPTQTFSFTDTLPAGLVVGAGATGGSCTGGTVTATAGTNTITVTNRQVVNPATSCTITIPVTTAASPTVGTCPVANNTNGNGNIGATTNVTAAVANSAAGGGTSATGACVTVNPATPTVDKAFGGALTVGGAQTLTFTVSQPTGNPTQTFSFTDALPAGLVVGAGATGGTCAGGTVTATAGTNTITVTNRQVVNPATSCTITIPVTTAASPTVGMCPVANNTNGNGNIGATTNVTAAVTDSAAGGGTSATGACVTVNAATPTLDKAFGGALTVGGSQVLTFTVSQPTGNPTQAFSFTDTLPAGLVVGAGATGGSCSGGSVTATAGTNTITVTNRQVVNPATTCTITVPVTTAASPTTGTCPVASNTNGDGNISGAANLVAAIGNTAAGGGTSTTGACVTVSPATPTVDKAFGGALVVGGSTTLTFTVSQPGGSPTATFSFTDTLPAGLVVGAGATGGSCSGGSVTATAGTNTITVSNRQIVNPAASCTITVPVTTSATPTVGTCPVADNTNGNANIGATMNVTPAVTNSAAGGGASATGACVSVVAATPGLTKDFSPTTIAIGTGTTLTFTITQAAGNPTQAFSFTDTLPAGLVVGAGATGGSCTGGTVTATAGTNTITVTNRQIVNPATTCTITVPVTTAPAFVIGACPTAANTNGNASISGVANLVNNVADRCVDVTAAAPTLAKAFGPNPVATNQTSTLLVTITNPNAAAITVGAVTDTFPGGLVRAGTPATATTCSGGVVSSAAGSVTLTGGTVPANGSCTFQIDVVAATAGTYPNTIPAGGLTTNAGANAAAANASLVVTPVANLAIAKSGPATVVTGAAFSYTLVISNAGPDAASGATFADNVPAAVTGVSASCGAPTGGAACGAVNVAGNAVTGTVTTLPSGGSVTITINATAPATGAFSNTATVSPPAGTTDPVPGNDSSTVSTTVVYPDLQLSKSHAGSFSVGNNGVYMLTVSNALGTAPTTGVVTVVDTLPTGLTFVSATGPGWACVSAPPQVTCTTNAAIAAGASSTAITLTVAVGSTAAPAVTNSAVVSGGGEPAATTGDNATSDPTAVNAAALNTFGPDGAQSGPPGAVLFYPHTFNAALAGTVVFSTSSAQSPVVPGWTQIIYRDTDCNGVLNGAEGTTPLSGGIVVVPGDAVCIVVKDSIPGTAPFNAVNNITVTSTFNGASTISRQDVTTVAGAGGSGLVLAKSVRNVTLGGAAGTANTARPNDELEYTITYSNSAAGVITNIVVTDATPAFTTYLSAACTLPLPPALTGCSVTQQPAVNGTGSVVWTITGGLQSAASGSVTYRVRVAN